MSIWDEERSNDLAARLANGETFRTIGAELTAKYKVKISRNSCIGRARRMGLESVRKPGEADPANATKVKRPKRERLIRVKPKPAEHRPVYNVVKSGGGGFRIQESRTSDMPSLRCVEIEPRHLTLLDLASGDCRYPYGGDFEGEPITFCGHPAQTDKPYCRKHADLCFTEPKPRKDTYVTRKVSRFVA
jgi:GcrA cell cycle regulator